MYIYSFMTRAHCYAKHYKLHIDIYQISKRVCSLFTPWHGFPRDFPMKNLNLKLPVQSIYAWMSWAIFQLKRCALRWQNINQKDAFPFNACVCVCSVIIIVVVDAKRARVLRKTVHGYAAAASEFCAVKGYTIDISLALHIVPAPFALALSFSFRIINHLIIKEALWSACVLALRYWFSIVLLLVGGRFLCVG